MLHAHLCMAFAAGHLVAQPQDHLAPFRRAALLLLLRPLRLVAVGREVPPPRDVSVLVPLHADGLAADGADDDFRVLARGVGALVLIVRAVLDAVHVMAAVAFERQEVALLACGDAAHGAEVELHQRVCVTAVESEASQNS